MFEQVIHSNKYNELRSIYKYYIDLYISLYQLKTGNEEELKSIYKMIKTELIDSNGYSPQMIMKDILNIIPYNNRYTKSYLFLTKLISDDYHVKYVPNIPTISNNMFYKEYGIILDKYFKPRKREEIQDIHEENTIYKAIMHDDIEIFISFTEREGFDKDRKLGSNAYPNDYQWYSLLELCCYYGSVRCFKFLRTKFNSEISYTCLNFSFLGGNPEIMSECLKHQTPNVYCMEYAIISHNIDFVTFLMNEYNVQIDLECCGIYHNLESFLVYFDQTNNINKSFIYSTMFDIPSLWEYFILHGANINEKYVNGDSILHKAAWRNNKKLIELLISHGVNINAKGEKGRTALHIAVNNNKKEIVELLLLNGANINEKCENLRTALHIAVLKNFKEIAELLLSHGANINEKSKYRNTALHYASEYNSKKLVELLLSHGAHINEKDDSGRTALHIAVLDNSKQTVELLLSHGAHINEKDDRGRTALRYAAEKNNKEIIELFLSYGANINETDGDGSAAQLL
ncbi:hypothetical protein TVAG_266940 [Trichomonas vaginalis G3]|uniref:DUF3447 domain-containing protein n=1 Tax=Trichomonas vaginalis (strain ATCC PRA-98 / G3) TaxID=412133 RepID=A2DQP7_TRIV3|nr:ankyrin repeat and SOCS box-containing protein 4 family [Trichomonas vaginalis G3]EAY17331.1 hypothetical protein TVAG_266940 [Trichomonas vaginalis G3]KAI5523178.1 ankyrin repeat and SOCS box-containing protein 4 family [Trichomonas vaginalis G3]|eukprot:XP_001329554.1 hypothetical protein [Trichomonas vaginalis G3]